MKALRMRLAAFSFLALFLFALAPDLALAQSKAVVVERRDGDITLRQSDGAMLFDETWVVRFISGPFRFAFRCIPTDRVERISGDWTITESGKTFALANSEQPYTFTTYNNDKDERCVKWFFPSTTNQTRTFQVKYTVYGGLRIYPGGDQFFWNFIESDRQYPIDASTVTLHIPGDLMPEQIKASAAENLAENSAQATVRDGNTVVFTGRNFGAGDLWTLRAQFPHGIVNAQPAAWQTASDAREATAPFVNFGAVALALFALIGGGLGLYALWYTQGRDKPTGVIAEFIPTPPTDDPPGVAGVLLDERAHMQDIVATIVDLARRGVIRMTEKTEPSFLGIGTKRDFTFERLDNGTPLREYEQTILNKMFGTRDEIDLQDLKEKFYKYLPTIKKELDRSVVRAGYYTSSPASARTRYSLLGVGALVLLGCIGFLFLGALAEISPLAFCPLVAFALVGVGLIILAQFMPKRTDAGATAVAKWNAFKRYLANIEKYTNVAQAQDLFDKYLPYAIAFGLERSWVNKFAAVDTPAPTWYYPYGGYYGPRHPYGGTLSAGRPSSGGDGGNLPSLDQASAAGFRGLNSMSDGLFSMLNSTSAVFASAPSSSGSGGWSGGGGGFSGGGGGGSSGFG